jgi:hypothetical protein
MADSLLDHIYSQIRDRARELKPAVLESKRLTAALVALDSFVCELADQGSGFHDPLAGYLRPRQGRLTAQGSSGPPAHVFVTTTAQGFSTRIWT